MQFLNLPFKHCRITADYLSKKYAEYFNFKHYGVDLVPYNEDNIYSLGSGVVLECGLDGFNSGEGMGNVIVIKYSNVFYKGKIIDVIARFYHLDSINVKKNDTIEKGECLGKCGNTGAMTTGKHLHLEFDLDINNPCHAFGAKGNKIIKRGTAFTNINPCDIVYKGYSQTVVTPYTSWVTTNFKHEETYKNNLIKKIVGVLEGV